MAVKKVIGAGQTIVLGSAIAATGVSADQWDLHNLNQALATRKAVVVEPIGGNATVTIEMSPDGGTTWVAVATFTAVAATTIQFFDQAWGLIRYNLSAKTATTVDIYLTV